MTVIVVDANVLLPALSDDGVDGQRARARSSGQTLAAPELGAPGLACSVELLRRP